MLELPRQMGRVTCSHGVVKTTPEDFLVEEIPLYPPSGEGTHTYFLVEKRGVTTASAVFGIAKALNVRRSDIGYAGLKDARAVTRQWMSIEHVDPRVVQALDLPRVRILEVARHRNKLKRGHLRGNRFVIRVREVNPAELAALQQALEHLSRVGVPNYFGIQRFGVRGDTWRIGRAVVLGRTDEAVDLILGRPADEDVGDILEARRLYDAGDYARAARTWPGIFHEERRALKALVRSGGVRKVAFRGIDRRTRELYVSAYQSYLFNCAVAARLSDGLGRLHRGDLAWRHANGAVFRVEDPVAEQPRADHFEISPTGPLFGRRMTAPEGWPAEVEAGVLATESLDPATLSEGAFRLLGGRRPLRFRPENISASLGADERGSYFELCFALDRGCYATALLRELFAPAPGGALAMDG